MPKPQAPITIAEHLTARERIALFCAAADIDHTAGHRLERLLVYCSARDCWHAGTVTRDELERRSIPETATMVDVRGHPRCTRCGAGNPDVAGKVAGPISSLQRTKDRRRE